MDNTNCNIIQDLLPLYADAVLSQESRELVERHLENCDACREMLEEIRGEVQIPEHTDAAVLKKIRRKERFILISPILCLIVFVYLVISQPMLARIRDAGVDYGPEDCRVLTTAEGDPIIQLSNRAKGGNILYLYDVDEAGNAEVYICIESNAHSMLGEFTSRLMKWDFWGDSVYVTPTLGLNPPHAHHSNYPGTKELLFDETVTAVYYQSITYEEAGDFFTNYLGLWERLGELSVLANYEIPESTERTLLWSAEE